MEFKYSSVLVLPESETQGLHQGIPIRVHKNRELEDYGSIRAQEDWSKAVKPLGFYKGGLGPRMGFISAIVPECLPDRLEYVSYANEFEFIYDDMVDVWNDAEIAAEGDGRLQVFKLWTAAANSTSAGDAKLLISQNHSSPIMNLQANMIRHALEIDREAALWTIKLWAGYVEQGAGRQNHASFDTFEDYIEYRYHDIGTMLMTFEIGFGMGLVVPTSEHTTLLSLGRPAWIAVALTNDLFSWDKECRYAAAHKNISDFTTIFHCLPILMRQHDTNLEGAKELLKEAIRAYVAEYIVTVEANKDNMELSDGLRLYLEALMYAVSGNLAFHTDCPRYYVDRKHSERQLNWMENGTPAECPGGRGRQIVNGKGDASE
ncbi:isoprenoid synthase domain-containing protein [Podospora didyma]|uniref:Isoprenoid synthase domain-containing protein n=1 Tax=Podospora didyma TaxID=330526 RepID=A0AAE0P5W7_9PEZI|nr:isoprenoid synthase domain-containing protein [Podospora didyma]